MAREVDWTESAVADLEAIAEYISRDSALYAAAVVKRIMDAARSLSILAERGRVVPECQDDAIREIMVYQYRLVYRVDARVLVLRIIHGARNFPDMQL